jgi:hypothetical protein
VVHGHDCPGEDEVKVVGNGMEDGMVEAGVEGGILEDQREGGPVFPEGGMIGFDGEVAVAEGDVGDEGVFGFVVGGGFSGDGGVGEESEEEKGEGAVDESGARHE